MRTARLVIGGLVVGLLATSAAEARCDGFGYCRPSYNQSPGQYTGGYNPPRFRPNEPSFDDYQRRATRVPPNDFMYGQSGIQPAPTIPPWNSRRY